MGKSFSEFEVCKDFKHKHKAKLLKYLDVLYDQKSELNSVASIIERKKAICHRIGLNPDEPSIKEIIEMQNTEFNNLAHHYISYFKCNNTFQQMLTDQHLFWSIQKTLSSPVVTTDIEEEDLIKKYKQRAELSELSDKIQKRINGFLTEMYKDDEEMKDVVEHTIRKTKSYEEYLREKANVQANQ